jgi:hypothetical protein
MLWGQDRHEGRAGLLKPIWTAKRETASGSGTCLKRGQSGEPGTGQNAQHRVAILIQPFLTQADSHVDTSPRFTRRRSCTGSLALDPDRDASETLNVNVGRLRLQSGDLDHSNPEDEGVRRASRPGRAPMYGDFARLRA